MKRAQTLPLLLALAVAALLVAFVHGPVLRAQALSIDDTAYIADNPLVSRPGWESAGRFFAEIARPSTFKGYYHPISMVALMLETAAGGSPADLRVFHLTSLALHVANTMLAGLVLYALFGAWLPAALAALLFGLHPLTVEPVAWVGEQKALLAAGFGFASVLAYLHFARGRGGAWRVASVLLFLLALLSKPTVIALPLLLLVLDAWPLGRRAWIEKWPWALLSLAFAAVTLVSQHGVGSLGISSGADALRWPLRVGFVLASHLAHIAWPHSLTCIYPQPVPFSLGNPSVLASVAGVLALTVLVFAIARRWRAPAAGWVFFVLALAPTLGPVKYTWALAFDNYTYFPALGLLLVLTAGFAAAEKRLTASSRVLSLAGLTLIAGLAWAEAAGVRTTLRHWKDTATLNQYMAALAPDAPVIHLRLAVQTADADASGAIGHLRRAIELEPQYADAHYNLGVLLAQRGKLDEAIREFDLATHMDPEDPKAAFNFGVALHLAGRLDEAEPVFRRVLELQPDHVETLDHLGGIAATRGRPPEAVDRFRAAVMLRPGDPLLHYRLASALTLQGGHASEVKEQLATAVRLSPDWPQATNDLAWLLATAPDSALRDPAEALRLSGREVVRTKRGDPRLLDTYAVAQAAAGQFAEAAATAREAIRIAAAHPDPVLAAEIRRHLTFFERSRPWRAP